MWHRLPQPGRDSEKLNNEGPASRPLRADNNGSSISGVGCSAAGSCYRHCREVRLWPALVSQSILEELQSHLLTYSVLSFSVFHLLSDRTLVVLPNSIFQSCFLTSSSPAAFLLFHRSLSWHCNSPQSLQMASSFSLSITLPLPPFRHHLSAATADSLTTKTSSSAALQRPNLSDSPFIRPLSLSPKADSVHNKGSGLSLKARTALQLAQNLYKHSPPGVPAEGKYFIYSLEICFPTQFQIFD